MTLVAHQKLPGLDAERVLAVVEPVLRSHAVEGVELVWRTDQGGWLLELTIERPNTRVPGEGVTIDVCTDVSRDLSAALDVADVIKCAYRLEVGSPGLERALYVLNDYVRFAGQLAKLKLTAPVGGQRVVRGTLMGLNDKGEVELETDKGLQSFAFGSIESGRLVFDWNAARAKPKGQKPAKRAASRGR